MTDTLTRYRLIVQDLPNSLKRKAAEPTVSRDTAYYEANIGKVRTVDDLMADRRLYTYAMKAYGLEDMTYAKAFMRKVMTEGAGSRTSFANRLSDDRYVAFARAFNFATTLSAAGTDPESFGKAAVPARLSARTELAETTDFSGSQEARFVIESRIDATTVKSVTITLNAKTLKGTASDLKKVTREEIAQAINAQISATGDTGLKDKLQVGIGVNKSLFFETKAFQSLGADGKPGGTGRNADITVFAGGKTRRSRSATSPSPRRTEPPSMSDSARISVPKPRPRPSPPPICGKRWRTTRAARIPASASPSTSPAWRRPFPALTRSSAIGRSAKSPTRWPGCHPPAARRPRKRWQRARS